MKRQTFGVLRIAELLFATMAFVALAPLANGSARQTEGASYPPSRSLSRELTAEARLAGTSGSRRGAEFVARVLKEAGWEVEVDPRQVMLSLPRRLAIAGFASAEARRPLFERRRSFDPDALPPGDVPPFNAWSRSGKLRAPVIDVGRGLRADFERLLEMGLDPDGCIALARYGGSYRGVKARLAEEFGCVGLLLFSDPEGDGDGAGTVWPAGPWKPDWAVQRGSIAPMARAPGDPSTPGWASPGEEGEVPRLSAEELAEALPKILCLPIPVREARELLSGLGRMSLGREASADKDQAHAALGPGPVEVELEIDQPRQLRRILNIHARLAGEGDLLVIAGNHRDAWVRGAHDAGSGTVALLRAAQRLGARARTGWRPKETLQLSFWDAEEQGLIGSTEWAEDHEQELRERCIAYINGDSVVSGAEFRGASGSPGLLGILRRALEDTPVLGDAGAKYKNLWQAWRAHLGDTPPSLGLAGSGSDYTVFLHHLGLPVLDITFAGSSGGQYHTSFDDFALVDRFIDPDWIGHETAGAFFAALLVRCAEAGFASFDEGEAAGSMARLVEANADWLGPLHAQALARAFDKLAADGRVRAGENRFYMQLEARDGLSGRSWFKNRLWAPGLETGYSSEALPSLRRAAQVSSAALAAETESLLRALHRLAGE